MTELELRKINYTKGGNNYVARAEAENHWVGFAQSVVNSLIESYGDNFNFIVYWHNKHNYNRQNDLYNFVKRNVQKSKFFVSV